MPFSEQVLKSTIEDAWEIAWQKGKHIQENPLKPRPTKYERRSALWVDCLAKKLQSKHRDQQEYRVFWRSSGSNDNTFPDELLFDITVCRMGEVNSLEAKPKSLAYVKANEWAVESELDMGNFRSIILDMSKLVLATSKKKLFVASHRPGDTEKKILDRCFQMAENCSGKVYFCFIEHPENWEKQRNLIPPPCLYKWTESDGWTPL